MGRQGGRRYSPAQPSQVQTRQPPLSPAARREGEAAARAAAAVEVTVMEMAEARDAVEARVGVEEAK